MHKRAILLIDQGNELGDDHDHANGQGDDQDDGQAIGTEKAKP